MASCTLKANMPHKLKFGLLLAVLTLSGCANKTSVPPLYGWGQYEKNIDTYFRADRESLDTQAKLMEEDSIKMRAAGQSLPPGYQAHMGLLYGKQGEMNRFQQHLEAEKKQFPESEAFIDFLLRKFKK